MDAKGLIAHGVLLQMTDKAKTMSYFLDISGRDWVLTQTPLTFGLSSSRPS